jgi:Ras-related protein Rab-5C
MPLNYLLLLLPSHLFALLPFLSPDRFRFQKLVQMSRPIQVLRAFKVAFIGPADTGKTSVINRFHEGDFSLCLGSTVGASFVTDDVRTVHGVVMLNIWDTAGQERYKSLIPMYCRGADVLVVVYDVSIKESFGESQEWYTQFRENAGGRMRDVYYVGNKADLTWDEAEVDAAREYAASIGAEHSNTSAKTGEGITELFQRIAEKLIARPQQERPRIELAGAKQKSCRC